MRWQRLRDRSARRSVLASRFLALVCCLSAATGATTAVSAQERAVAAPGSADQLAEQILATADVPGGLVVHLGAADGRLTAALRRNPNYVVHGLDRDADSVRQARQHIDSLGLYGAVSVDRFDGKRLPYAENLVNLVVAADLGDVPQAEVLRVLAPGGRLCVEQNGQWTMTVKPRPTNIDEWTHFLYDASGNPVAHDEEVGPPGSLQWTDGPEYMRSHEHIPGLYALVSSAGRVFYILDESPVASVREMPQWQLVARDAFNGILLWKKPVADWYPHIVNWGQTPVQLQRRLVSVGDRVYVTLGWHAPLSELSATTGETLRVYDDTLGVEELICHQGILLVVTRDVTEKRLAEREKWSKMLRRGEVALFDRDSAEPLVQGLRSTEQSGDLRIQAIEVDSGRLLWKKSGPEVTGLRPLSLCAEGDRVCYQSGRGVVCVDLRTGRERWSASAGRLYLLQDGVVVCADGNNATLLSLETGEQRWQQPHLLTEARDAFIAGGSVWIGGFKPFPEKRGPSWGPYFATQLELANGKLVKHIEPENPSHHHRCYSNKATDRYILGGRRGTEFIDLASGEVLWNSWARGVCKYGVMPCNGLVYVPPHACGCYMAAKLIGFNAMGPARKSPDARPEGPDAPLLEQGPAFDDPLAAASGATGSSADWPTYRHDAARSGSTASAVPEALQLRWQADIGGRLTPPTVAGGRVFVASADEQRLCALDADSGSLGWQFIAGGRVDSPPTIAQGRAVFGCRDGSVYNLRLSDGALAWRRRVAREDRRVVASGQLESVSPVPGSVLVDDGKLYCTAGRSSYLDGGIDLCRLDFRSGELVSRTSIYSPDPETGKQPPQLGPAAVPGAREDILSADGDAIYLRDLAWNRNTGAPAAGSPHLFAMTSFRDDQWAHRAYWIYGTQCSVAGGCSSRDKQLVYGRLLVHDAATVYGYGRAGVHWSNQFQDGPYRLFAVDNAAWPARWEKRLPIQVRAMILAGKVLLVAGPPVGSSVGPWDPAQDASNQLVAVSTADGSILSQTPLPATPVFDGLAAANGRLYVAFENGAIACLE